MTGPKNLRDVAAGELGDVLLQAARNEAHDQSAMERTLVALSLAASVTALGGVGVAKAAAEAGVLGAGGALSAGGGVAGGSVVGSGAGAVSSLSSAAAAGGMAGSGLSALGAPGATGVAASAMTKGALLITFGKWFGATTIAASAALGGVQLWERAHTSNSTASTLVVAPAAKADADSPSQLSAAAVGQANAAAKLQPAAAEAIEPTSVPGATKSLVAAVPARRVNSAPRAADDAVLERAALRSTAPTAVPGSGVQASPAPSAVTASEGTLAVLPAPSPSVVYSEPVGPAVDSPNLAKANAQPPRRGVTLALEVRSIDAARERLKAGDAAQALSLLVKHRAQFGSGALGPEALFLQMEAERALGRRVAALRTARQILERFPKGPSAESARQLLAE